MKRAKTVFLVLMILGLIGILLPLKVKADTITAPTIYQTINAGETKAVNAIKVDEDSWFMFKPQETGRYFLESTSQCHILMEIYTLTDTNTLTFAGSSSNQSAANKFSAKLNLRQGKVYYIKTKLGDHAIANYNLSLKKLNIALNQTSLNMEFTTTYQLKPVVTPEEYGNDIITQLSYASSNAKVATVDANGIVTAVGIGQCTITAKAGDFISTECNVTVGLPSLSGKYGVGKVLTSPKMNPGTSSWYSFNCVADGNYSICIDDEAIVDVNLYELQNETTLNKIDLNIGSRNDQATYAADLSEGTVYYYCITLKLDAQASEVTSSFRCNYCPTDPDTVNNNPVVLKKAVIKSVRSPKRRTMITEFYKVSGATKYQIKLSTVKNFKKNCKTLNTAKTKATIIKLIAGKRYYIMVRAMKKGTDGKWIYGKYSAVKSVRIRK